MPASGTVDNIKQNGYSLHTSCTKTHFLIFTFSHAVFFSLCSMIYRTQGFFLLDRKTIAVYTVNIAIADVCCGCGRRPYLWHQCSTLGHCVPCLLQQSGGFFFVPIEQVRKPPFRRSAFSIPIHSHNTICTFRKCHLPVLCPVQKAEIPHPYCHRELPVFHSNRILRPRKFLFQAMDNDAYHLGISFQSTPPCGVRHSPHFYFYYITLASNPLYFFILSVIIKGTELF